MPIEAEMVLRLLLAAVFGAVVGFQRELAGKPAGLRTHALIATGAALFTVASLYGFGSSADVSRVAAGVVVGVGFIGGGVILHRTGGSVEGLTTAATVWIAASIGLTVGAGLYLAAAAATAIILAVLFLPHKTG